MLGVADFVLLIRDSGEIEKHYSTFVGRSNPNRIVIPSADYSELCKLYNLPRRFFPPQRFERSYKTVLNTSGARYTNMPKDFPWNKVIPKKIYNRELEKLVENLQEDFSGLNLNYYFGPYKRHSVIFKSLRRAAIDLRQFEAFIADGNETSSKAILKTFETETLHRGRAYCSKVLYDRLSSITGRLVVKGGPNILHLRKDYRQIIKSQWGEDGAVYYLDYKSLEPRILLALKDSNLKTPKDLYLHVAKQMGVEDSIDRKLIKAVIISMIYGSGDDELVKKLKGKIDYPEDFIASIKEQFGVEELKDRLRDEYEANGGKLILNLYERPIFSESTPPYVLVNYFIQSTAVDVALNGFSNIIERLAKSDGLKLVRPLFILHDALILDVHNSAKPLLAKFAKAGSINIPKFDNTQFWIDVEQLS